MKASALLSTILTVSLFSISAQAHLNYDDILHAREWADNVLERRVNDHQPHNDLNSREYALAGFTTRELVNQLKSRLYLRTDANDDVSGSGTAHNTGSLDNGGGSQHDSHTAPQPASVPVPQPGPVIHTPNHRGAKPPKSILKKPNNAGDPTRIKPPVRFDE